MITIENYDIYGFEAAIRGMRNPMNSWNLSDSVFMDESGYTHFITGEGAKYKDDIYDWGWFGEKDISLMKSLAKSGRDHRKFMRMIVVSCDITAPLYWWKEFDTYKVGTVANSCSTMHKLMAKPFTANDFSHEYWDIEGDDGQILDILNHTRDKYLETKDRKYWYKCIQMLPSSYNQRRTVMLNYEVLSNMYASRVNHKQDEWKEFCNWIAWLPLSELIMGEENK